MYISALKFHLDLAIEYIFPIKNLLVCTLFKINTRKIVYAKKLLTYKTKLLQNGW